MYIKHWLFLLTMALASSDRTSALGIEKSSAMPVAQSCEQLSGSLTDKAGLRIASCDVVKDPMTIDVIAPIMHMESCRLPSGIAIAQEWEKGDRLNGAIVGTLGETEVFRTLIEPRSKIKGVGFGVQKTVICDTEERLYYLSCLHGYLRAISSSGRPLWEQPIPGFQALEANAAVLANPVVPTIFGALEKSASLATQVVLSGEYLLVEVQFAAAGTRHFVYHRSGKLLASAGPWDARVIDAVPTGWRLVAGGGVDLATYVPTVEFTLSLNGERLKSTIEHGLAWLQPRPTDRVATFNCLSRPPTELRYWLGASFKEEDATRASATIAALGGESWAAEVMGRRQVASVLKEFRPADPLWRKRFRAALIADGVDVDFATKLGPLE